MSSLDLLERAGVLVRLAAVAFVAWSLWHRLGWVDTTAVVLSAVLVLRALRPGSSFVVEPVVVSVKVEGVTSEPGARARAIERALERIRREA